MKKVLKATLFILFGSIIASVSSAQHISPDSLIIGKWKLKSSWVNRGSKVEYMPMNNIGTFVYEFKSDGTYVNLSINESLTDTAFMYGHWELKNNGKKLHLSNAFYKSIDSSTKVKLFPSALDAQMNIVALSPKELTLNGDPHYEEADSATIHLYTSLYTRVK